MCVCVRGCEQSRINLGRDVFVLHMYTVGDARQHAPGPIFKARLLRTKYDSISKRHVLESCRRDVNRALNTGRGGVKS